MRAKLLPGVCLLASTVVGSAMASDVFPFKFQEFALDNGLRVVAIPFDSPGLVAYYTVARVGSRNEVEPGLSGFAHFFEHMMFHGTAKYSQEKYNEVLKSLGIDSNAFTSDDYTCYHMLAPSTSLETIIDLESDRFQNLRYTVEEFRKEAGAVLGEYRKNFSIPFRSIEERLQDTAYTAHTYKHTTMGFLKDIEDMPNQFDYSRKFFDRFYRPENCVVLVAGDFDQRQLELLVKKYYGAWQRGSYQAQIPAEPAQGEERRAHIAWDNPTLPILTLAYHVPAFSAEQIDMPTLDVISQLVFSESAPLFQELVIDKQIVDMLAGSAFDHRDPGLFEITARVKDGKDVPAVEASIEQALEKLKNEPIDARRLDEVKSHMKYGFAMRLDTVANVAETVAHYLNLTGDVRSINKVYALYDRISAADVQSVARKHFTRANRSVITLSNDQLAPAAAASTASVPDIETVLLPSQSSPLIAFRILFRLGAINDPAGKQGLNALTAAMLAQGGTRELSYQQIIDKLYPMSAAIESSTDKEMTVFAGEVHKDHAEAFFKILSDLIIAPRFDPEDFKRNQEMAINYLESTLRGNDDENLGKQALSAMIFRGHPYGYPSIGTVKGLQGITLDDVKQYYAQHYRRGNVVVGLAGGYSDAFLNRVRSVLASLPAGTTPRVELEAPPLPSGLEVELIEKPCIATAVSIGFPIDVTRADHDFFALMVANSYFGEHRTFNGVLMQHMRGLRGMNYGDYSYIENFEEQPGTVFPEPNNARRQQIFSIWIRPVAHRNRHFAIRQAMRELQILCERGLTDADFQATRQFLLNYTRLWAQRLSARLGYKLDSKYYGLDDFLARVQSELPKLTAQDVNRAIKQHLQFQNACIAVVTQHADEFAQELVANKPSPIEYQETTPPAVLEEDKLIERYDLKITRTSVLPAFQMF
ncbi:MAG: pitrilysin family protein [Planctomycetota bacterium]